MGFWARPDRKWRAPDRARARLAGSAILLLVLAGCPARVLPVTGEPLPPPTPAPAAAAIELWVDGSAAEGGNGTKQAPFKQLGPALQAGAVVHLRSGLYAGPFVLPPNVRLVGHGQAVLYAEGEQTVLTADGPVGLASLSVQGGFVGLDAKGPAALIGIHFSGHRRVALTAVAELTVEDSVLDGTVSETVGIQLRKEARGTLKKVRFTGAFRRAIDAVDATLKVEDLTSEGPAQALHVQGGTTVAAQVAVAGGSGPAVFSAGGALWLTDATVNGHEYAVQARGTKLTLSRVRSNRVQLAGIATVDCTGTLTDTQVEQSGSYGALQLLDSTLTVKGLKVKQARASAVFVRKGSVTLEGATLEQTRGDRDQTGGDALHVRDAELEASDVVVRDADGVGAFATAHATVTLRRFSCERCRVGAVVAELQSDVKAFGLVARGGEGPVAAVLDKSTLTLEDAEVVTSEVAIWAECDHGARVTLKRVKSNLPMPQSGCIAQ